MERLVLLWFKSTYHMWNIWCCCDLNQRIIRETFLLLWFKSTGHIWNIWCSCGLNQRIVYGTLDA